METVFEGVRYEAGVTWSEQIPVSSSENGNELLFAYKNGNFLRIYATVSYSKNASISHLTTLKAAYTTHYKLCVLIHIV
jgi:hypothetical protein